MRSRTPKQAVRQGKKRGRAKQIDQLLRPLVTGVVAKARETLTSWVECRGLEVLGEVLRADAERIAGAKGKRRRKRTANHWGTIAAEFASEVIGAPRVRYRLTRGRSVSVQIHSESHPERGIVRLGSFGRWRFAAPRARHIDAEMAHERDDGRHRGEQPMCAPVGQDRLKIRGAGEHDGADSPVDRQDIRTPQL